MLGNGRRYNKRLQPTIASVTTLADARLAPATLAAEANVSQSKGVLVSADRVSNEEFKSLVTDLIGMPLTRPWRGYGSAVFLELGRLRRRSYVTRSGHSLKGRATVMVEWSWRVEGPRSVMFGSWSGERKMKNGIASLKGTKVQAITLEGSLPELRIALDDGRALQSFTTVEGQPEWALFLKDGSWLSVARGVVIRHRAAG